MQKVMYETNWHNTGEGVFIKHTVTPITVLRHGVLPGCSAPSITATDSRGNTFHGSIDNYFETEQAAHAAVKQDLIATLLALEQELKEAQCKANAIKAYLTDVFGEAEVAP